MKKKICVITGSRADYGILFPVMKKIKSAPNLKLYMVATSMHLMREFGYTATEIKKDGFNIYRTVDISYKDDSGRAMVSAVGRAVILFSDTFVKLRPDVVVLLGDRPEMLAAAITANYMNIPVAHIHGGEVSGHVDGVVRHVITKLSHIHFPATEESKNRIIKLGEDRRRVFLSGAPALDRILNERLSDKRSLFKKYGIKTGEPFFLLAQHPVMSEFKKAGNQMEVTLKAVSEFKIKTFVIYPNADAGGRRIIEAIKKYQKQSFIRTFKNIPHKDYLGLLKHSSALIGNSSSGIIEASSFKIPVINIGMRQRMRQRSTNIIDAPHDKKAIIRAIKKALYDKNFKARLKRCKNLYGDGCAAERIVKVLSNIKLDSGILEKRITY